MALRDPLILCVDDLQWAEPMLIELLDHIVELSRVAPIMVLCTARPELLDDQPEWGEARTNATIVRLEPLGANDCEQLLDHLGDQLDPGARARAIRTSEGNPLFLQEMVVLARERGSIDVPPTIQALLAARLERLGERERRLLERGAVEGQVFHASAVFALAGAPSPTEVEADLEALARKDLIRPHPPNVAGDKAHEATRKQLAEQLTKILTDAGDPRVVEKDCRFEKAPFTDAPPGMK